MTLPLAQVRLSEILKKDFEVVVAITVVSPAILKIGRATDGSLTSYNETC